MEEIQQNPMSIQILVAPAASGKTAHVLDLACRAAHGLQARPRVVVPSSLQAHAWRQRLAQAGGAIGVRILTFDSLYAECLAAASEAYTELSEPVQYRLIRAVLDSLPLAHYAPLVTRPGFAQVLERLIGELKAARVHPDAFAAAVEVIGNEPRLGELAQIYIAYQEHLQSQGWADRPGLGWLAVEALEERAPQVACDWPLLVVDGFDSFTSVQLALLKVLAGRARETIVTLTGTPNGYDRPLVHRRFDETRRTVEAALQVQASSIPRTSSDQAPALGHLEACLYQTPAPQHDAGGTVELVETPDRASEVRAALRWLKARLVEDGLAPGDVALLARGIVPYRSFILQTAAEFGLPIRLVAGFPLKTNPAITALLTLMRLMLPSPDGSGEPALPRRLVVEIWRSPYLDWSALPAAGALQPIGIVPGDADLLDSVARRGRVIGGLSQWQEALKSYAEPFTPEGGDEPGADRSPAPAPSTPTLHTKFLRFVQRLSPPGGERSLRELICWLEDLIGPDPVAALSPYPVPEETTALQMVAQARLNAGTEQRDIAALQAFKDVLRGLVWAEEALNTPPNVTFAAFVDELVGAVEAAAFQLPVDPSRAEVIVADVVQARGVPFRAVAVLGMAEGEFPTVIGEDPFLRDADRERLRVGFGFALEPSTQSAEAEFFYETVTRPRERLLLTRPRLADNGALWEASPFWEEVRRLLRVEPSVLTSETIPEPHQVASWPELMESLAACAGAGENDVRDWIRTRAPWRQEALDTAAQLIENRSQAVANGFDGDLSDWQDTFQQRFGPGYTWSASSLESYRSCPFFFYIRKVLGLEPREDPVEGLDARQLGTIYHHIFEAVYQAPGVDDPTDLDQLLAALQVEGRAILDAAPAQEGFRETAWWAQTRTEILNDVHRSLEALCSLPGDFVPHQHEAVFGLYRHPPLIVQAGDDRFHLRGFIDRVDQRADGCVRIVDYKTAGPWSYHNKSIADGKKLQLPLYALAARDALGLGEPVEGFYWHIRHAEPSSFQMSKFEGGPQGAIEVSVEKAWEAVRGARDGHFVPQTPDTGCPDYCPAASFCWHYRPGFGG